MSNLQEVAKHLAGKHPQKSHAGGRGSGGRRKKIPRSPLQSAISSIEGAIGQISEDHDDGLRKAADVIRKSSSVSNAKSNIIKESNKAERDKKPDDYIDAFDTAFGVL